MLYNIVLASAIHRCDQPQVYICPLPPEPSSHLPPLWVVTEHWLEFPVSHSKLPLAIYFTYGNVYISKLFSQLIPPSPSPTVSTSLFSMSLSIFNVLCYWKN